MRLLLDFTYDEMREWVEKYGPEEYTVGNSGGKPVTYHCPVAKFLQSTIDINAKSCLGFAYVHGVRADLPKFAGNMTGQILEPWGDKMQTYTRQQVLNILEDMNNRTQETVKKYTLSATFDDSHKTYELPF